MNKSIYLFISLMIFFGSCKREKPKIFTEKAGIKKSEYYRIKRIVFNNQERARLGIPQIDSISFTREIFEKERVTFEKDKPNKNEIFKIEFNIKHDIVLDSYLIGKDSILRIQTRTKEGVYQQELFALLDYTRSARFLDFKETEELCYKKNLFNKKDTIFYGFELINGRFKANLKEELYDGLPTEKLDY